jgi:hypothetical protein
MMKAALAYFLVLFVWSPMLSAEDVTITVRLVNGRNGKPITDENLNVFLNGSGFAENYRADKNGTIRLTVDRNATASFASNIDVTCHPYTSNERQQKQYRVSEILDHGISDENLCSKKIRVEARDGEFVFFERPRTLLEWWRL